MILGTTSIASMEANIVAEPVRSNTYKDNTNCKTIPADMAIAEAIQKNNNSYR